MALHFTDTEFADRKARLLAGMKAADIDALLAEGFSPEEIEEALADQATEQDGPAPLPSGWEERPSQSRPGKSSYENIKTGQRYDRLPNSAFE